MWYADSIDTGPNFYYLLTVVSDDLVLDQEKGQKAIKINGLYIYIYIKDDVSIRYTNLENDEH